MSSDGLPIVPVGCLEGGEGKAEPFGGEFVPGCFEGTVDVESTYAARFPVWKVGEKGVNPEVQIILEFAQITVDECFRCFSAHVATANRVRWDINIANVFPLFKNGAFSSAKL